MATLLTNVAAGEVIARYQTARQRLFCMDYDGTLRPFTATPAESTPPASLVALLGALAAHPANTVAIVSGRDQTYLTSWFGGLPIGLSAEHGQFMRLPGDSWHNTLPLDDTWKEPVSHILTAAVAQLPGALVEAKQTALCFHYRRADSDKVAPILQGIERQLAPLGLVLTHGNKVLEIRKSLSTKAAALDYWQARAADFVLIAGDDTSDESMFQAAPPGAITIKIQPGPTSARYRLQTPDLFVQFLRQLLETT